MTLSYNGDMPPKVRELEACLTNAGFVWKAGKGSHRHYLHPNGQKVTISGQRGDDAKPYQIREVERAVRSATGK